MNKRLLIILCALGLSFSAGAQGLRDMRINEVLVENVDSYADDFGHKVGWIELYNSGYASANLSGAYIRLISGSDTTSYRIPTNDARTVVPPQGYAIFFADGSTHKGTFYTNFVLGAVNSGENFQGVNQTLELLDQSGNVIIDNLSYNTGDMAEDVSYGRYTDYSNGESSLRVLEHATPLQTNNVEVEEKKSEIFRQNDPNGIAMAITAMSVVFTALLLLYLIFKNLGRFMQRGARRKERKAAAAAEAAAAASQVSVTAEDEELTGEELAAIALAIRLYEDDIHDIESNVITINKVARAYSPWSSKIYSLRQLPNKKTW